MSVDLLAFRSHLVRYSSAAHFAIEWPKLAGFIHWTEIFSKSVCFCEQNLMSCLMVAREWRGFLYLSRLPHEFQVVDLHVLRNVLWVESQGNLSMKLLTI